MAPIRDAFLSLLGASLGNSSAAPIPELTGQQWTELFALAHAHKVLPLVFEPAYPLVHRADSALAAAAKRQVRQQVIAQTLRTAEFLELYRKLTASGATPLVVKGIICRRLYPKPDHRPSSDEDVLIPPEQLALCRRVMEDFGMSTPETDPDAYEFPYRKPGSPLYIELHRSLFPPKSEAYGDLNDYFRDVFRTAVEADVQGQNVLTLHPTDHMTYLILHAFKHFLHSGFGIRQICDMLLFAGSYDGHIDWGYVQRSCRSVRAEKFAAAVFTIGVKHLGFAPVGSWEEVNELPLLEDVLRAGVYGSSDENRLHSSTITLKAASSQKASPSGILAAAFPSAGALEGRYPWLKHRPYLLPAAWGHRIIGYLRHGAAPAESLRIGAERVELLRQYGIVK